MGNPSNLGNQKLFIDLLYLVQLYDILINLIYQTIIYVFWLSFVIADSKDVYFYYVSNLLIMPFHFGTATMKRHGKSPLFSGASI